LSWKGVLPEGLRLDRVVSSLDINATMLDALGAPPLPGSRGRSILDHVANPEGEHWEDVAFSEYCTDEGCYHRMVRSGPWKLNYYHDQDPQLFNLEEDPHELVDRSRDPAYQDVLQTLTTRVLEGWDPDSISRDMALRSADLSILRDWARHTQPEDHYRWALRPEMDYLD
jgi:choline-sulfatase